MKIVNPSAELAAITNNPTRLIEEAGRTCYKSESSITAESAAAFVKMLIKRGHESVLEHASAAFRIVCDRGVSHELVRHRLASYSPESTRYCNYEKKGLVCVKPSMVSEEIIGVYDIEWDLSSPNRAKCNNMPESNFFYPSEILWFESCAFAEFYYNELIACGWSPQYARSVLPNCLKTEVVMTANFREWRHFLKLRCAPAAHPDMRVVANIIKGKLLEYCPEVFEDLA